MAHSMTLRSIPGREAAQHGFTLVEAIMVIVLTGIIAAVVAVFIRSPVQGYIDTVRRGQLSDEADFALRRIARDIHTALPNSVRAAVVGNQHFLEFLPVRSAGRYRVSADGGTDRLNIANPADNNFDVLSHGASPGVSVSSGDLIAIYNTGQSGANAYAGDNTRAVSSTTPALPTTAATNIVVSGTQFPRDSSSYRFQVISTPVTYACETATGTLWRFSGYTIQSSQPTTLNVSPLVSGQRLATNVVCPSGGTDIGTGFAVQNADGLVLLRIQLRDSSGETLSLYREVHIDNAP